MNNPYLRLHKRTRMTLNCNKIPILPGKATETRNKFCTHFVSNHLTMSQSAKIVYYQHALNDERLLHCQAYSLLQSLRNINNGTDFGKSSHATCLLSTWVRVQGSELHLLNHSYGPMHRAPGRLTHTNFGSIDKPESLLYIERHDR